MIKEVYLVSAKDGEGWGPLQRFNGATRFLEPVEWPATLADVKKAIDDAAPPRHSAANPAGATTTSFVLRQGVPTTWASAPALVIGAPLLMVSHLDVRTDGRTLPPPVRMSSGLRYTIVLLDASYMKNEMLPALAQQHFQGAGDGFDYELAVIPAQGGQAPLYRSVSEF